MKRYIELERIEIGGKLAACGIKASTINDVYDRGEKRYIVRTGKNNGFFVTNSYQEIMDQLNG